MTFPVSLLSMAFTKKYKCSLRPMLSRIFLYHVGMRDSKGLADDMKDVTDFYGLSKPTAIDIWQLARPNSNDFWEDATAYYNAFPKKQPIPYASMTANLFGDFWFDDCSKTDFEKQSLLAYLALKSILGNKIGGFVNWEFLLSRMAGNIGKLPIEDLPETVQRYNSRKLKDKLRKCLISKWKVQYYFKGRQPWFSFKREPFLLQEWVNKRGTP